MMMMPKKKNIASMIISKMQNPMGEMSEEITEKEGTEDFSLGQEAAAEDILAAIETKNVKLLVQAMKDLHFMIDDEKEAEEGENGNDIESNEGIG
jgi:hypothetical protein